MQPLEASAKPARCFTTDDGTYPCEFKPLDRAGSFEIWGRGKASFQIIVDRPGVAYGMIRAERDWTSLPGIFLRDRRDPACWVNDDTNTEICAW